MNQTSTAQPKVTSADSDAQDQPGPVRAARQQESDQTTGHPGHQRIDQIGNKSFAERADLDPGRQAGLMARSTGHRGFHQLLLVGRLDR